MDGDNWIQEMTNYDPVDPLETLMTVCLLGAITICVFLSCGCATTKCPECVPEIQVVSVSVPVPSCEPPAVLPILEYPDWPTLVTDPSTLDGSLTDREAELLVEAQLKAFYAQCVAVQHAREKIMLEAIRSRDLILEEYRVSSGQ